MTVSSLSDSISVISKTREYASECIARVLENADGLSEKEFIRKISILSVIPSACEESSPVCFYEDFSVCKTNVRNDGKAVLL